MRSPKALPFQHKKSSVVKIFFKRKSYSLLAFSLSLAFISTKFSQIGTDFFFTNFTQSLQN